MTSHITTIKHYNVTSFLYNIPVRRGLYLSQDMHIKETKSEFYITTFGKLPVNVWNKLIKASIVHRTELKNDPDDFRYRYSVAKNPKVREILSKYFYWDGVGTKKSLYIIPTSETTINYKNKSFIESISVGAYNLMLGRALGTDSDSKINAKKEIVIPTYTAVDISFLKNDASFKNSKVMYMKKGCFYIVKLFSGKHNPFTKFREEFNTTMFDACDSMDNLKIAFFAKNILDLDTDQTNSLLQSLVDQSDIQYKTVLIELLSILNTSVSTDMSLEEFTAAVEKLELNTPIEVQNIITSILNPILKDMPIGKKKVKESSYTTKEPSKECTKKETTNDKFWNLFHATTPHNSLISLDEEPYLVKWSSLEEGNLSFNAVPLSNPLDDTLQFRQSENDMFQAYKNLMIVWRSKVTTTNRVTSCSFKNMIINKIVTTSYFPQ